MTGHLRAHRQAVVFDDKDDRELEEGGEVQCFVVSPLVHSTITEEREAYAAGFLVLSREGRPDAQRNMSADDSMAAEVPHFGLEEVHRAALPLGATIDSSKQLRHRRIRAHPQRQRMAVIAIAIDEVVFALLKHGRDASGDGFLSAIEVAESADALAGLGVFLVGAFFE